MPGQIVFAGHSTVRVDLDGTRLLTDPVLRNRVAHLRRRVPLDAGVTRGVDAVLVSHLHYDHLDLPSLQRLGSEMPLVVPRGAGAMLRRRRFARVLEVEPGEELEVGALKVGVVEAAHDGGRAPLGARAVAVGYLIAGSARVYFPGDTDIFESMAALAPLDVALMPVWGWGPSLGRGHLDPHRAAEALRLLRPRIAVPIHWGTFSPMRPTRSDAAFLRDPPHLFARYAAELAPGVEVRVLAPGEALVLT